MVKIYPLHQIKKDDPRWSNRHRYLSNSKEWITSFYGSHTRSRKERMELSEVQRNIVELKRNFRTTDTHAGLIYYFHYCWGKELTAVLRPDMIWFTIISEIASEVVAHPKYYQNLFVQHEGKMQITLTRMI